MKKTIGSKIIIYAFFIKFVLFTGKGIISPLIPLISKELGVGLDYIGSIISLSVIALFFVSLTTGNLIEVIGLKKVIYWIWFEYGGFDIIILLQHIPSVYPCLFHYETWYRDDCYKSPLSDQHLLS